MLNITFNYFNQYEHLPNTSVLSHIHTVYEIVYYTKGTGKIVVDNKEYSYSPNTYFIHPPKQPHSEFHIEASSVWCIAFLSQGATTPITTGLFRDKCGKLAESIKRIISELDSHERYFNIMLDLYANELIINHMRMHQPIQEEFDKIYYIICTIDNNFNQDISTEALGKMSGYSYHHFRHLFKVKTGYSPVNYIIYKRIEHAKALLTETDKGISSIALECGFCSSSQFSMLFKRFEHTTPSQYRVKDLLQRQSKG